MAAIVEMAALAMSASLSAGSADGWGEIFVLAAKTKQEIGQEDCVRDDGHVQRGRMNEQRS